MKKPLKLLSALLLAIPLLSNCSDMFKPKTMTIEYDEEVKLHDGSMIWVHITRHYLLVGGGALGDAGAFKKSYMPKEVDNFYIVGGTPNKSVVVSENSQSCKDIGAKVLTRRCLVALNPKGEFFKENPNIIRKFNNMNILYPENIKDWGNFPSELKGKKLTWVEKISLQSHQPTNYRRIGKPFLTEE